MVHLSHFITIWGKIILAKTWDNIMKRMVAANPQHFLNWLIPGAILVRELSPLLKTRDFEADGLYVIIWYGQEVILHIEFQRRGDKEMGKRLWEYNTTTIINSGLPVYSIVIYLRKEREIVEPPYVYSLPDGEPLHVFSYRAVRLWELPASLFFQPGLEGLLPLVTLTQDGKQREIVDAMIKRLIANGKSDLLGFAYTFASLTFLEVGEREWLIERFAMYKKELEGSWAYQEILEEGREQERERLLREMLIDFLEVRYPMLVDLAKEQTNLIKNAEILRQAVHKVCGLQTAGEVEEYLLALGDDATKN